MKILIVDDDKELNNKLCEYLTQNGIEASCSYDGVEALGYLQDNQCDLILMDIDMPNLDGISALKKIKTFSNVPVIIMSERTAEMDVIFAYEAGCIDYIRKPFYFKEICLKLKNWSSKGTAKVLRYGGIEIDSLGRTISIDGERKNLTQKEFQLLKYLVDNSGIAIEREKLLNDVWGYGFFGDDRTIDTHIKMLRSSLGKYKDYIQTIRGYGYKFEVK